MEILGERPLNVNGWGQDIFFQILGLKLFVMTTLSYNFFGLRFE